MVRLRIKVADISLVLQSYDLVKIHRSATELGSYNEITDATTRLVLEEELVIYYYEDSDGADSDWYKVSYFNSSNLDESPLSSALQGGAEEEKIGYTFGNYSAPPREWGKVYTADDMRYTMLFGIDTIAADTARSEWTDEQFDQQVLEALYEFERKLHIDIRKRVYKTNPAITLIRSRLWREGVDYTDEDDEYAYDYLQWSNMGFLQLRHNPIISVERAIWKNLVDGQIMDLIDNDWIRINKKMGQLNFYPKGGFTYGPYSVYGPVWTSAAGGRYPQGFEIDSTCGYESSDFVPEGLRGVIAEYATIKALSVIGDGLLAGFSSQSISLDGLSESFSSTQSATSIKGNTQIFGYGTIEELYLKGKWHGKEVLSMNRRTNKLELKRILDVLKHDCSKKRSFKIKTEKGNTITITEDHSLFTTGMKEIKGDAIKTGTLLLCKNYEDKVSSIIETKIDWMYDLSVEDNENFIANDFIVHNSAYFGARIKQLADHIADWIKENRYLYAPIPMSFVGS